MDGDQGMVTTGQQAPGPATVAQRWLARLALVAAAAAVLLAPVVAGRAWPWCWSGWSAWR